MVRARPCEWIIVLLMTSLAAAQQQREQHFDHDPQWEGVGNVDHRDHYPTVTQDFGYSPTHFTSKDAGEIGGKIWRSSTPASYAAAIDPATLDQDFDASGTLVLTQSTSGSGIMFGFFNHDFVPGERPTNSIMFHISGENKGVRMFVRAESATNSASGLSVERANASRKDILFPPDGTVHHWSLHYDAHAREIQATFDDLPPMKAQLSDDVVKSGITVDRFGVINEQKSGQWMCLYLGDITLTGRPMDLSHDPNWQGVGNRATFEDHEIAADQDFGYRTTSFAGGQAGEMGGTIWRTDKPVAWYADKIGPLDLEHPLHASGKVTLKVGAPDSGICLGWFNSAATNEGSHDFLGAHIEGPTRVGHYFAPAYAIADAKPQIARQAPVLVPDGKPHTFSIDYDPKGDGVIRATLDGDSTDFPVKPEERQRGATFDRFGLISIHVGGNQVKLFVDDLSYSAAK